ncbi:hypothetical protein KQI41_07905 [Tissierella pigra]|uniref:Uncharacterized protein n=1 Tax=Tissierella pigra TaxID=2607614 RepID=A0A6N7Y1U5_9FIRM|nr:hypothetical protein [Tissierella pigra]MBU5426337.1 hypothetical protein [Tissierella pigra]MSU02715.1 hypothetical protein [Tissierella pigra]
MNSMIQKYVSQGFMTEAEGNYIDEAIQRKESVIVSGHRSAGIRPLMAALMAVAKSNFNSVQVKGFEDLNNDVEYYLIPGLDNLDFEKLIAEAMSKPNTSFVTLKEPEHPYSLLKLLRQVYKETGDTSKVYHMLECSKIDNVPKLTKVTKMSLDENGKIIKVDFGG